MGEIAENREGYLLLTKLTFDNKTLKTKQQQKNTFLNILAAKPFVPCASGLSLEQRTAAAVEMQCLPQTLLSRRSPPCSLTGLVPRSRACVFLTQGSDLILLI